MMTRNPIRESEESRYRETQRMCRELRTERPGDYRDGKLLVESKPQNKTDCETKTTPE